MALFRTINWIAFALIFFGQAARASDVCSAALAPDSVALTTTEQQHLDLTSRLDRLQYLRLDPPRDEIIPLRKQIRNLEAEIRAQDPERAESVFKRNRLQALDELYSHFAEEKEKYDAFHSSWSWRKNHPGRNDRFGRRFERITLAYMKEHEITYVPHYEGRLRDGVTISPDANGSYLNRLAFRLKHRLNVNLVASPRNLVSEATDGMFSPGPRDVYVSKDFLRTLSLETTTRHELVHAYIDSFMVAGIPTPFDVEVTALEGEKISLYATSGYDDYEDASEVATYAQEVADGGKALRATMNGSADETKFKSVVVRKLQPPAQEGEKLTRAMIDSLQDAIQAVQAHLPLTISAGQVDIPVGNRATLTLRRIGFANLSPEAVTDSVVLSRLRQILDFHQRMLVAYSRLNQKIATALSEPADLSELADASLALKRLAFSELARR